MRKSSWEIILAGFIFVGVSIYLIEYNSATEDKLHTASSTDSVQVNFNPNQLRVVELKNLQKLENVKQFENLKNLEKLKSLAHFMPAEVKSEFLNEIDEVIREFDEESLDIQVDIDKGLVSIDRAQRISPGSWNTISPGVFAYVNEFDATSLEKTLLSLPFGSITISGTEDDNAKLVIQASGQISSKKDLESKIETLSHIDDNKAEFQLISLSSKPSDENIHLQATINLPVNTEVTMVTKAGHIQSTNITGQQSYETEGGHITLKQLNGGVNAVTSGGHINISHSNGKISLRSFGGHIRARDTDGNIKMKTSGGNLQATNISGQVEASTNGGNIELRFLDVTGTTSATTGAGSITIWVPRSEDAEVDLAGNSVDLDSELNFDGSKSSGRIKGHLGKGGPVIKAKTNYGKVILKAND